MGVDIRLKMPSEVRTQKLIEHPIAKGVLKPGLKFAGLQILRVLRNLDALWALIFSTRMVRKVGPNLRDEEREQFENIEARYMGRGFF